MKQGRKSPYLPLQHLALSLYTLYLLLLSSAFAQLQEVHVLKTETAIRVDGILDEAIWQETIPADNFWQWFPTDTVKASYQTEIHMAFDEQFLYVRGYLLLCWRQLCYSFPQTGFQGKRGRQCYAGV